MLTRLGLSIVTITMFAGWSCGGGDSAAKSPTLLPSTTTTATASTAATPVPVTETPAANGLPRAYPAGTRTGIAEADAVLAALEAPTPDGLKALFMLTPSPCVNDPKTITNPPLCPPGVAAKTMVPVFRAMGCEAHWPDYLESVLSGAWKYPRPLLAIFRTVPEAFAWLPAADYGVIIETRGAPTVVVRISAAKVNGIDTGCGQGLDHFVEGVTASRFILPLQR